MPASSQDARAPVIFLFFLEALSSSSNRVQERRPRPLRCEADRAVDSDIVFHTKKADTDHSVVAVPFGFRGMSLAPDGSPV